jgi:hypothetical protein
MAQQRLRMTVAQVPHRSLIVALAAGAAAEFENGPARSALVTVHVTALTFWAYGELVSGVNWFRRLLGAGVLIAILVVLTLAFVA